MTVNINVIDRNKLDYMSKGTKFMYVTNKQTVC